MNAKESQLNLKITKQHLKYLLFFLALFSTYTYFSLNRSSDHDLYTYRSEIWADKAGYYVYLPALTIYQFEPHAFPDSIQKKLGNGFEINLKDSVVENKYTSGLAILWAPFYGIAHTYAKITSYKANGFTKPYYKSLNYAGSFYFAIATILLYLILYYQGISHFNASLTILAILLGTNAYYYLIDENGMSHIYNFSILIYLIWLFRLFYQRPNLLLAAFIGLLSGLLVLIRPTNVIILGLIPLYNAMNFRNLRSRLQLLFKPTYLSVMAVTFLLVWVPQSLYWQYAYDTYLAYSYGGEGFSNWDNPKILNVLFNPNNGLIPNSPVILLCLAGIIWQLIYDCWNGVLVLSGFCILTYLFASWHVWHFGCSLGQRSFIDFYLFLCFPLALLLNRFSFKHPFKWFLMALLGFFIWFTLQLSYSYKDCFFGDFWDWQYFFSLVF